jgi:hypothetical protein
VRRWPFTVSTDTRSSVAICWFVAEGRTRATLRVRAAERHDHSALRRREPCGSEHRVGDDGAGAGPLGSVKTSTVAPTRSSSPSCSATRPSSRRPLTKVGTATSGGWSAAPRRRTLRAHGARLEIRLSAPAYDDGRPTLRFSDRRELSRVRGYRTFRQVALAGSFEGQTTLGLGVRARLPFRRVHPSRSGQRLATRRRRRPPLVSAGVRPRRPRGGGPGARRRTARPAAARTRRGRADRCAGVAAARRTTSRRR